MRISRRAIDALLLAGTTAALSLGLATGGALAQSDGVSHLGIPVDRIGVVGYTFRGQISEDPRGTLEAVAACGIENIEFSFPSLAGDVPAFLGVSVPDIKAYSEEFGFAVPSLGVNGGDLTDRMDVVIASANELGATHIRISGTNRIEGEPEADYYGRLATLLNEAGAVLKAEGITLSYHNHDAEFEDIGDGQTGYDILLAEVDPDNAAFELDLYWAVNGAADPIELITENPGRFVLFHVKDAQRVTVDGEEQITFATVGQGFIDFPTILALPEVADVEYFFIENDRPEPDGVTSTCEGYAYLSAATAP